MDTSTGRRHDLIRHRYTSGAWGEDSDTIYAHDRSGRLYRVPLDNNKSPIPVRVQLPGIDKWKAILYPRSYNPYLYVKSLDPFDNKQPIYRCKLDIKARTWGNCELAAKESRDSEQFVFSVTGELVARLTHPQAERKHIQTLNRNLEWRTLTSVRGIGQLYIFNLARSDNTVWAVSDGYGKYETVSLVRINLLTGQETVHYRNEKFDLTSAAVTHTGVPLFAQYDPGYPAIKFFRDDVRQAFEALFRLTGEPASAKLLSNDDEGRFLIVRVRSKKVVSAPFLVDLKTAKVRQLSTHPLQKFGDWIPATRPVSIKARDGMTIHGYLTIHDNYDAPPPLIIQIHGGPWRREYWGASGEERFFSTRGVSVLRLNYRGSVGYNKRYKEAGFGEVFGAMKTDIHDAAQWAISRGYASKEKIVLFGGSFGGLMVLLAMIDQPGRYAAGIAINPVSDAEAFWKKEWKRPYNRLAWQETFRAEQLPASEIARNSPLRNAGRIKDPILFFTSQFDQRIPQEGTWKLRRKIKSVSYHTEYKGIGHDISKAPSVLLVHMYDTIIDFLKKKVRIDPSQ